MANSRNSPMSFVIAERPDGINRRVPPALIIRIAATWTSGAGSPNSSRTRPVITPPRNREKSTRSIVWPSRMSSGFPGSFGRCWPHCKGMKLPF
jgi:hypothetical protein